MTYKTKVKKKEMLFFGGLVAFPMIQFLIFYIAVNFNSFLLAFQKYDVETGKFIFTDGKAFLDFFNDVLYSNMMHTLIKNSFIAYLTGLLISLPLNLIFSYFIYKKIFMYKVYRIVLFLPQILSTFTLSIMFQYFIDLGIPKFFELVGVADFPSLLVYPKTVLPTVLFYCIWSGFGAQILIYSSAMSRIPESLVEVGNLDGISRIREFFSVTVPLIFPTITTFLIAGVAGFFTNQIQLFNFYAGAARPSVQTLGYYFFTMVLGSEDLAFPKYPYASAAGLVFTFIAAPLTLLVKYVLEKITPVTEF